MQIGSIPGMAMIDTGATISVISEAFANRCGEYGNFLNVWQNIRMADGTTTQINCAFEAELRLGHQKCTMRCLVLPGATDDLILGTDFLSKMSGSVIIGDMEVQIKAKHPATSLQTITSVKDIDDQSEEINIETEYEPDKNPTINNECPTPETIISHY